MSSWHGGKGSGRRSENRSKFESNYDRIFNKKTALIKVQTKQELQAIIRNSPVDADLNHLDTSALTDLSWLFENSQFNGDISSWNVSNVTTMRGMFSLSSFIGDISQWDVSSVTDMSRMLDDSPLEATPPSWYK